MKARLMILFALLSTPSIGGSKPVLDTPFTATRMFGFEDSEVIVTPAFFFDELRRMDIANRVLLIPTEFAMPVVEGVLVDGDRGRILTTFGLERDPRELPRALVSYPFVFEGRLDECLDRLDEFGLDEGAVIEVQRPFDARWLESAKPPRYYASRLSVGDIWNTLASNLEYGWLGIRNSVWTSELIGSMLESRLNVGAARFFRCSLQEGRFPPMWRDLNFGLCREILITDVLDLNWYLSECFRRDRGEKELVLFLLSRHSGVVCVIRRGQQLDRLVLRPGTAVLVVSLSEFEEDEANFLRRLSSQSLPLLKRIAQTHAKERSEDPWLGPRNLADLRSP